MKNKINFDSTIENKAVFFKKNKKDLYKILNYLTHQLDKKTKYVVSLNLYTREQVHQLNKEYRNVDRTTDVLSFPQNSKENNLMDLGDIFINGDDLEKQAKEIESNEDMEFKFLFLHGLLHLLGYDHIIKEEEKIMLDKQKEVLRATKIRND